MWWLSFLGGGVAIMEATSLAQARLLAVVNGLGRASHFVEGYSINPDLAALIPTIPSDGYSPPWRPGSCSS
jgi:hypothetical protein